MISETHESAGASEFWDTGGTTTTALLTFYGSPQGHLHSLRRLNSEIPSSFTWALTRTIPKPETHTHLPVKEAIIDTRFCLSRCCLWGIFSFLHHEEHYALATHLETTLLFRALKSAWWSFCADADPNSDQQSF